MVETGQSWPLPEAVLEDEDEVDKDEKQGDEDGDDEGKEDGNDR